MRKLIFIILIILPATNSFAQQGSLVYKVQKDKVLFKWYSEQLVRPEGYYLYKSVNNNNWAKVNSTPIKRGNEINDQELSQNEELRESYDFTKDMRYSDFRGVVLLNSIIQSFKSNVFANYLGIYFEDDFSTNQKVKYRITSSTGKLIAESDFVQKQNIGAPDDIRIEKKRKKIAFSWEFNDKQFWGVNIYRSKDDSAYVKINKYPILQSHDENGETKYIFEDEDVKDESIYKYYITSLGYFEEESSPSKTFKFYFEDHTPPNPPYGLRKVNVKKNEVNIKWEKSKPNPDIKYLNVYRSTYADSAFVKVNSQPLTKNSSAFTDITSQEQGYYYYKIGSVDESGNVGFSNPLFVEVYDLLPPTKPQHFKAVIDTGKVTFLWDLGKEEDLLGYRIYRTVNPNWKKHELMLVNNDIIDTNVYTDVLPKRAKNDFYYVLVSLDKNFNESIYAGPIRVKLPDITPPSPPFIRNIYQEKGFLSIDFEQNKESDFFYYTLYRKNESSKWKKINQKNIPGYVNRYRDRSATTKTNYAYYLTATDSSGNESVQSNILFYKTKDKLSLNDAKLSIRVKYNEKKHKAVLNWSSILSSDELLGVTLYHQLENQRLERIRDLELNEKLVLKVNKGSQLYQMRLHDKEGNIYRKDFEIE